MGKKITAEKISCFSKFANKHPRMDVVFPQRFPNLYYEKYIIGEKATNC